jgi:FkbM family methyltransferase
VTSVVSTTWSHPSNRAHRVGAVVRLARAEVSARITGRPVDVPLGRRSRIRAHLHAGGSWRVVQANPPDFAEQQLWARILRPGDLFVDVGANAGVYTIWALDAGAEVVAVEPDSEMVRQLRANLELNGYRSEVVPCALSNEPGHATFGGPDLLRQRLQTTTEHAGSVTTADTEVEVRTLDGVLARRPARGVKIDVEGYERLVLEGAHAALAERTVDVFQLEWNDTVESALGESRAPTTRLLHDAGYVLFRPGPDGTLTELSDPGYGADVFAATPDVLDRLRNGSA